MIIMLSIPYNNFYYVFPIIDLITDNWISLLILFLFFFVTSSFWLLKVPLIADSYSKAFYFINYLNIIYFSNRFFLINDQYITFLFINIQFILFDCQKQICVYVLEVRCSVLQVEICSIIHSGVDLTTNF